ncbi:MAG TPA: hypothetical protein VIK89_15650 [Cytophagaceae bacterium]
MKKRFFIVTGFFFCLLFAFSIYILLSIFDSSKDFGQLLLKYQHNSQVFFLSNFLCSLFLILLANSICLRQVLTGWEKTKIIGSSYLHFIFYCLVEWVLFSAAFTQVKLESTGQALRTPVEELLAVYIGIVAVIVYVLNEAFLTARNKRVIQYLKKKNISGNQ